MRTTDNFEHYDFLYDRFLDYCHEEYFKKYYDFLNEIQSQFSPTDRLIRIIEKIISFNTDIKYDKEIENVISPFMNDECSSQELPFPFTWLDQDSISSYKLNIIGVRDALNSSLCALLNEIRDRFSIDQYEHLMKNGISIINQNTELFTISPLLFPIGVWKKIVKYELSLFSIEQKEIEVKKMWYNIRDLKARIKYDYIFDSNLFAHEWDDKYKITYLGQANLCDFNIPTKSLTNYIENIKLEHIKYFHKESLIDEMNSIYKRSRIVLNSNYKQNEIIKFFNIYDHK